MARVFLAESLAEMTNGARGVVTERLEEVTALLAAQKERLARVGRELALLENAKWVAASLERFDSVWSALTDANRGRLIRALVRTVVVDDRTGEVQLELGVDLGAGESAQTPGAAS